MDENHQKEEKDTGKAKEHLWELEGGFQMLEGGLRRKEERFTKTARDLESIEKKVNGNFQNIEESTKRIREWTQEANEEKRSLEEVKRIVEGKRIAEEK